MRRDVKFLTFPIQWFTFCHIVFVIFEQATVYIFNQMSNRQIIFSIFNLTFNLNCTTKIIIIHLSKIFVDLSNDLFLYLYIYLSIFTRLQFLIYFIPFLIVFILFLYNKLKRKREIDRIAKAAKTKIQ